MQQATATKADIAVSLCNLKMLYCNPMFCSDIFIPRAPLQSLAKALPYWL